MEIFVESTAATAPPAFWLVQLVNVDPTMAVFDELDEANTAPPNPFELQPSNKHENISTDAFITFCNP